MTTEHKNEPQQPDFTPPEAETTCKKCSATFTTPVFNFGKVTMQADYCDACEADVEAEYEKREANQRQESLKLEREAKYDSICPKWPEPTDIDRIPAPRKSVERVLSWRYNSKGLLLIGDTGSGKTRTVWLLLRRLMVDELRDVMAIKSTALAQRLGEAAGNSMSDHSALLRRLCQAQILFIDDLGKQRFTDRHDSDIFTVIDERTENGRPTIITTRYDGEALAGRFFDAMTGRDVVRRIREFTQGVVFSKPTTEAK